MLLSIFFNLLACTSAVIFGSSVVTSWLPTVDLVLSFSITSLVCWSGWSVSPISSILKLLTSNPNYPEGKIYKGYKWYNSKTEKFNSNIKIHRVPTIPRGRSNYFLIILNYLGFIIFGTFFGLQKLKRTNFDIILVFASSPIFQLIIG